MPSILGHNYVGGARSAAGNLILRSLDADSGEALPYAFVQATEAEVDAAARAAERAYPHYRQLSATRRAGFLEAIASRLDALGDDFVALVRRETALPAVRIQGERTRTANQLRLFAEVLRRGDFHGARIDRGQPGRTPPRPDLRQWRIGLGPVAVFGASNFPLAFSTAGGDSAAALAAGCPVVVKAHGGHMATAECVADAILQAAADSGMPAGVFNMVYGSGIGETLVRHPAIRAVGFTGSLKGGRALCDLAAARPQPIPVFAEMSSINPLVVLPEALRRRGRQVAEELADSVTLGCGQFCTKPGLVLGLRSPASTPSSRPWARHWPPGRHRACSTPVPCAAMSKDCNAWSAILASGAWPARHRKDGRPIRSCSRPTWACCWKATNCSRKRCSARPPWSSRRPTRNSLPARWTTCTAS